MGAGLSFTGTITVEVDTFLLQAFLNLVKQGDQLIDDAAVFRLLSKAGVTSGFEAKGVIHAVQRFANSSDTQARLLIAKGELPDPPRSEQWIWQENLSLPAEMKDLSGKVAKAAGHPEVFNIRTEKVRVQKKVGAKGGALANDKQGFETSVENREVREKVLVDPNPGKVYFVSAGALVAQVSPPRLGKPGKDLAGQTIAPPDSKPAPFYTGKYLLRQRNEVFAESSGFLRIGRNWADVVPFEQHRWQVTYSADKTSAFLTLEPGSSQAQPLQAEFVLAHLNENGFPSKLLPDPTDLQQLIDAVVSTRKALFDHPITANREGGFEVHFSPDKSQAFLTIVKPLGKGKPISLKDLGTKLREANLKGFNFETVKGAITEFLASSQTELKDFLLATGKAPTRSGIRQLVYKVSFLAPEETEQLRKSFEGNGIDRLDKVTPAKAGQVLAVFQDEKGSRGKQGLDVCGQPIPPLPGQEPPIVLLTGVRRNGDDLEAVRDGLLEIGPSGNATAFRMRLHQDATVVVAKAADNMSAYISMSQNKGSGKPLSRAQVDAVLLREQVTHGVMFDKIDEAFKVLEGGGIVDKVLIAKGTPAGNDLERRLTFTTPLRTDSKGLRRCVARAGEVVAEFQPPQYDQVDGKDVLGNLVPSKDMEIRPLLVSLDFAVEIAEDGRQLIKPLKNGDLVLVGESLSLVSQVAITSVASGAGGVKFTGEVVVSGGVETGTYVMAGSVKIRGRVGGALLSSDTNIQVSEGIHGEGKAVLRAKKHVSVGFMERCLVMAVGDLHIGKSALACTLRINGKVYQKTSAGGIVGGLVKTRLGLDVMNLGSAAGVHTHVSFGQDYLIEDQIVAELKETEKLRDAIVHLDAIMRRLSGPLDRDKLGGAARKKVLLIKMLEKRNLRLIHLREKFEPHTPSEIVVRESLFPGVAIESHGRLYEVKNRKSAIRLVFNQQTGHIEESPLA